MTAFGGFPRETFVFLRGIARNNDKKWFDAHRSDYDAYYMAPARAFVEDLGARLQSIAPDIVVDPRVNGSIRRINRDTRFSKDKRPYKTWLDLQFWNGEGKRCGKASFFLHMTADKLILGAGAHGFPDGQLAAYRKAVIDKSAGPALAKAVEKIEKAGYTVGGAVYKRVPKGFDAQHPNAAYLLHTGLYVYQEMKLPAEAASHKFSAQCMNHYKKLAPLFNWIGSNTAAA